MSVDHVEVLHQAMRTLLDTSAAPQDLRIVAGLGALVDHAKATGAVTRDLWLALATVIWDRPVGGAQPTDETTLSRMTDDQISRGLHRLSIDLIKDTLTGQPQTVSQISSKSGLPVVTVERLLGEVGAVNDGAGWLILNDQP